MHSLFEVCPELFATLHVISRLLLELHLLHGLGPQVRFHAVPVSALTQLHVPSVEHPVPGFCSCWPNPQSVK